MNLPILISDAESETRPIHVSIKIEIPKNLIKSKTPLKEGL
jgi:hypothetical protein